MKVKNKNSDGNSSPSQQKQTFKEYDELLALQLQFSPYFDVSPLLNTPTSKFTAKYQYDIDFDALAFKQDYGRAIHQICLFQTNLCQNLKKYSTLGRFSDTIFHIVQCLTRISQFCFHRVQAMRDKIQNDSKQINQLKNIIPKSHCQNCGGILRKQTIKNIRNELLQLPKFYDDPQDFNGCQQNGNHQDDEIQTLQCFLISQQKMKNKLCKLQTNLDQRKYDISTCLIQLGEFKNKVVDYSNKRVNDQQFQKFNGQKMMFNITQYFYQNIKQVQDQIKQIKQKFYPKTHADQEVQVDTISKKVQRQIQLKKKKLQFTYKTQIEQLKLQKLNLTGKVEEFEKAYAKYMKQQQKTDSALILKGIAQIQLKRSLEKLFTKNTKLQKDLQIAKSLLSKANIPHSFADNSKQNSIPQTQSMSILNKKSANSQGFQSYAALKYNNSPKAKFGKGKRRTSILNQLNQHIGLIKNNNESESLDNTINDKQKYTNCLIISWTVNLTIQPYRQKEENKINFKLLKNKSKKTFTMAQKNSKIQQFNNEKQQIASKFKNIKRTKRKKLNQKLNTQSKSEQKIIVRYQSQFQASKQKQKKLQAIYKKKKKLDMFQSKDSDSQLINSYNNQLQKSKQIKLQKYQHSKKNISLHQIISKRNQANPKKTAGELTKKQKKRNFSQDYEEKKYIIDYIPGCQVAQNQQQEIQIKQIFTKTDQDQIFGVIKFNLEKVLKNKTKHQNKNGQNCSLQKIKAKQKIKILNISTQQTKQEKIMIQHEALMHQQLNYSTYLYANLATLHIMDKVIYKQIRQFLVKPFKQLNIEDNLPSLKSLVGYLLTKHRKCLKKDKQQVCGHMQNFLKKISNCKSQLNKQNNSCN